MLVASIPQPAICPSIYVLRTLSCTLQHRHKWRLFSLLLYKPTGEPNSSPLPWQPGMKRDGTLYMRQSREATLKTQLSSSKSVQRAAQKHWSLQKKVKLCKNSQFKIQRNIIDPIHGSLKGLHVVDGLSHWYIVFNNFTISSLPQ